MSEWLPIETAPACGKYFIGTNGVRVCVATIWNGKACWIVDSCSCEGGWPSPPFEKITHWMPMPEPPAAKDSQP